MAWIPADVWAHRTVRRLDPAQRYVTGRIVERCDSWGRLRLDVGDIADAADVDDDLVSRTLDALASGARPFLHTFGDGLAVVHGFDRMAKPEFLRNRPLPSIDTEPPAEVWEAAGCIRICRVNREGIDAHGKPGHYGTLTGCRECSALPNNGGAAVNAREQNPPNPQHSTAPNKTATPSATQSRTAGERAQAPVEDPADHPTPPRPMRTDPLAALGTEHRALAEEVCAHFAGRQPGVMGKTPEQMAHEIGPVLRFKSTEAGGVAAFARWCGKVMDITETIRAPGPYLRKVPIPPEPPPEAPNPSTLQGMYNGDAWAGDDERDEGPELTAPPVPQWDPGDKPEAWHRVIAALGVPAYDRIQWLDKLAVRAVSGGFELTAPDESHADRVRAEFLAAIQGAAGGARVTVRGA